MSAVLVGRNRFEDCDSILAFKGIPLLTVLFAPLRVHLQTPEDLPSRRTVRVDDTTVLPRDKLHVTSTPQSYAVFWEREHALAIATLLDAQTAHLRIDLRPLGINVYDDADGLHIGKNTFVGNTVSRAAVAINLG